MKVDINKTYRTKNGMPVVIYAIHGGQSFGVQGAWQEVIGVWHVCAWMVGGQADIFGPTDLDLVEVCPERVVWINEYGNEMGGVHNTKEEADSCASSDRIALHRVVLNEDTVWQADAEREGDDE